MFIVEDPLEESMTADITIDNGNVIIELPMISLINERGGLNISNKIYANGVFTKENSDYAPVCYHIDTEDVDVKIFEKRNKIFSFICIPAISRRSDFSRYDTLFIELDLMQDI